MLLLFFLPLISADFLEKSSKALKLYNLSSPYAHPQVLKVNASSPVEVKNFYCLQVLSNLKIRVSSCQFNGGALLATSKDAEIAVFPSELLKLMTDTSVGCPVDPFYGEPTANQRFHLLYHAKLYNIFSVYVSVSSKDSPVNYTISFPKQEHTFKFEVNSRFEIYVFPVLK